MLDHPKFLLFALFTFIMIHSFSVLSETGMMADPTMPSGGWGFSFGNLVGGIMFYNYSWLYGEWVYLRIILAIFQWVFVALILRDIARYIRGV